MSSIETLLIKQSKKNLSTKIDRNRLSSFVLIFCIYKTFKNFGMNLSNFRILTPSFLWPRPLILFAVWSCFDWTLFACSVSIFLSNYIFETTNLAFCSQNFSYFFQQFEKMHDSNWVNVIWFSLQASGGWFRLIKDNSCNLFYFWIRWQN